MSLPPNQPPPSPPPKPKLTAEERRSREADRRKRVQLRMMIWQALDDQGTTNTPVNLGAAFSMLETAAFELMTGRQWREGDMAMLEAVAVRLELQVPWLDPGYP
jgi:hypothetical protein